VPAAALWPACANNPTIKTFLLLLAGLLTGALLTGWFLRKDESSGPALPGTPLHAEVPAGRVAAPPAPDAPAVESAPVVASPEATAGPGVMGFPDGVEERIAQVLDRADLNPSQKADLLLAQLRQSPPAEQQDLIRHVACLYPDREWVRYQTLLADPTLDVAVRQTALETLSRDRPGWLLVEAVAMVFQNPRDPLRPIANQILKKIYPAVADYDLNSFRNVSRKEYQDNLAPGQTGPWGP